MEIKFTVDQVNQLLNALGDLPYKQAAGFIEFVKSIAEPQLKAQQADLNSEEKAAEF